MSEGKTCYSCKTHKPLTEFYKSNITYYQKECKVCNKLRKGRWHKTESGKLSSANTKLKIRFGITLDEYQSMLQSQDYKCRICSSETSYLGHKLAVDHCHTTGKIRGLLCKACNLGLGNFIDSVDLLENAIRYLKDNSSTNTI